MTVEKSDSEKSEQSEQSVTGPAAFTAITSQEALDRIVTDRLNRERAKFADYKEAKAKAEQFDALAEANKSELQKAVDRAAVLERERDEARVSGLRFRIAAAHGISSEDAELFLTGSDEDSLTRQAKRLTERGVGRPTRGNLVPGEGRNTTPELNDERAFARSLFAN